MGLIVQKFGGTSIGTPERIQSVARRIVETRREGHSVVVVVSAMGHTTDELLDLARQVSHHPQPREVDMLLTAGERISMALVSMALHDLGVPSLSFTGSQTGIITTVHHQRARIKTILGDRVKQALKEGFVAIVAGFQGVSETKEITTLGRGGSDTTAVALAASLKADRCDIFTDVNGVYTADPRFVSNARVHRKISHEHMVELASRGAGVLHPRSVELAQKYGVPLWVRNSLKPDSEGTEVVKIDTGMEESQVLGVTCDESKRLLEIELMRPSVMGAIWDVATEHQLTMLAPEFSGGFVRFFVDEHGQEDWQKACHALSVNGFIKRMGFMENLVPVSVVGSRLTQDGKILSKIFETLDQNAISVTMGHATSLTITLIVSRHRALEAVKVLHAVLLEQ